MDKFNFFPRKIILLGIFSVYFFMGIVNACVPYFLHKEFIPSQEELQDANIQIQGNLVFSENGKTLVFGSHYLGKVKVFNLINGQWILKGSLKPYFYPNSRGTNPIAISPDGKSIAFGRSESCIDLWHLNEDDDEWVCGESVENFIYRVDCIKFLANNLIVFKASQRLEIWQKRESGKWYPEYFQKCGFGFPQQLSASLDGLVIVNIYQKGLLFCLTGIDILTKSNENCWNLLSRTLNLNYKKCSAIQVSRDGEMIALGLKNENNIRLFNQNSLTGELDFIQELDPHFTQEIKSIAISLNKDIIVASDCNHVYVSNKNDDGRWNLGQILCDNNNDNQNYAVSVDISIDNVIAIGFNNGTVKVYFPAYLNPVEQKKCTASLVGNEDRIINHQVDQELQPLNVENPNLEQEQENVLGNLGKRSEEPEQKKKDRSKRKKLTHQEEQEPDLESVFVENSSTLI